MPIAGAIWIAMSACVFAACGGATTALEEDPPEATGLVPLTDLGTGTYLGFHGGLYPEGRNEPPSDHAAVGLTRLAGIAPLDELGREDPGGRIVLLSVGMSNTTQEFCSGPVTRCAPWSFVGQAAADPVVDQASLAIVDGAVGGHDAADWDDPDDPVYDRVRDDRLAILGLTEAQVRFVWIKQANARPTASLPSPAADAFRLEAALGRIVRALRKRYPNLGLTFISSRTYGGWATTPLNPEPFAYESGFAVKWLIAAQIEQTRTGRVDAEAGDLDLVSTPWLGWGPYLWTPGDVPRSDGLTWTRDDVADDGTHPSRSGEEKVGRLLLEFFRTSPFAACWFRAGLTCR